MGKINDATLAHGVFAPLGLCYIVGQGFILHGGYNAVIRNVSHGTSACLCLEEGCHLVFTFAPRTL